MVRIKRRLKHGKKPGTDLYGAPKTSGDLARVGKSRNQWKRYKRQARASGRDIDQVVYW